jgi:predicted alpha/beta hydrolase
MGHHMTISPIGVPARDGFTLGAMVRPAARSAIGVVLIHPATAVPQRLYASFAEALAARGFHVVTYDYRGIGHSRPASLRGFDARMQDWADLDAEGITDWARTRWPDLPLLAVGHSFGGHAIGLCEGSRHLAAAALVAAQAGSLRFITPLAERVRVTALLHGVVPLAATLMGYIPGSRLGLGEDLPAGVARQWSRWTGLHRYFFDDPALDAAGRFARVEAPLLVLGFDDDPWATAPAIDLLADHFRGTAVDRRQISPKAAGSGPIGHLGFFRRQHRDTLWPLLIDWLEERAAATVERLAVS